MKVLIIGGIQKTTEQLTTDDIRGCSTLYSYYIRKGFEKLGIETVFCRAGTSNAPHSYYEQLEIPEADHAICVEQKGFIVRDPLFFEIVRKKIPGKIATMCDSSRMKGPEDILFYTTLDDENETPIDDPSLVYLNWAVDMDICTPVKHDNIRILIDHSYYNRPCESVPDRSKDILLQLREYMSKTKRKDVTIRRFISGGIETVDLNEPWFEIYNRKGLSYTDACKEYGLSDIFIVTHKESMGLSVLESQAAGSLILAPRYFIKSDLIGDLHHILFDETIDFEEAFNSIDHQKSRTCASKYSWEPFVKLILSTLINGKT